MFYTIYKITNKINGKIYIGKHQTKDLNDGYMGSGKNLKRAIKKYGIENFEKEILFQFDNESDMNTKEAELVTEEFIKEDSNYNICPGGQGGFGYINSNGIGLYDNKSSEGKEKTKISAIINISKANTLEKYDEKLEHLKKATEERIKKYPNGTFKDKTHSDETKRKISESNSKLVGPKNSQFGTIWITNGKENKKIKKSDDIPENWYKGRTIRPRIPLRYERRVR